MTIPGAALLLILQNLLATGKAILWQSRELKIELKGKQHGYIDFK
jgi:hypothetical protein